MQIAPMQIRQIKISEKVLKKDYIRDRFAQGFTQLDQVIQAPSTFTVQMQMQTTLTSVNADV
jgi:hypothetical protein